MAKHKAYILFIMMSEVTCLSGFIHNSHRYHSCLGGSMIDLFAASKFPSDRASYSERPLKMTVTTNSEDCIWTDSDLYLSKSIIQPGPANMDYHLKSIDLSFPGIRVINSNPPVFEIDNFITAEHCNDLILMSENSQSTGPMSFGSSVKASCFTNLVFG